VFCDLIISPLQMLEKLVKMPTIEKLQEIILEDCPPMAIISLARDERNLVLDKCGAQNPPPTSFWSRRRLEDSDEWWMQVCQATPEQDSSKKTFFLQLVVKMKDKRTDVYAVSKVSSL
jgi:hypothetical protein